MRDSGSRPGASGRTTSANTVSRAIVERQPSVSVSTPPATMPMVKPSDSSVPEMPRARSRAGPSGKVVVSSDMPAGTIAAAARPCSARPARKDAGSQASVASSEAAPNRPRPVRSSLRRPYRSPMRPNRSRKPPEGSANAVTAHCRADWLMPRSSPRSGRATLRTEKSSATMNWAAHRTNRTSLSRVDSRGVPSGASVDADGGVVVSIAMRRASGDRNTGGESELMVVVVPPETTGEERYVPAVGATRSQRQNELREFLMSRRARVRPEEAGLPGGGGRRRTPGLRREEVAVLAGVGASWYQWLEQGRDISVSPQVLDAVARVLRLSDAERRHLYLLAGLNPPAPQVAPEKRDMCDGLRRLIDTWMPYPAHIMDVYYNCVMYNDAAALVLGMRPDNTQNCLIDFFADPLYRSRTAAAGSGTPARSSRSSGRRARPGRTTRGSSRCWPRRRPAAPSSGRCGPSGTSRTRGRSARSWTTRWSGCWSWSRP
ncbi:hypothetical protein GCM10017687_20420 [Streptomyces echinatus]